MASPDRLPLIFVTVGTDHHPFDRLVRWVDSWVAASRGERARVLVQTGTSSRPSRAAWSAYLPPDELEARLREAVAVVSHGGPGTIMGCRGMGIVPIVVPRRGSLGEHVDDHQVAFTSRLAERGDVRFARTEEELHRLIDRAVEDPSAFRTEARPGEVTDSVRRFEELVDELVAGGPRAPAGTGTGATSEAPSAAPPVSPVRVLYVGGSGRSGSTLLDRILGQVPGFFSAGELVHLWRRGLVEDQLCGCGEPFHSCSFWRRVGESAFGGWEHIDAGEVLVLQHDVDRNRYIPRMLFSSAAGAYARDLARYTSLLSSLYAGIRDVSGASVVVDSSKHPSVAFLLRRVRGVDLRVAHLVRDARGVAFSQGKRVRRPEIVGRTEYMPREGATRSGVEWLAFNGLFEALRLWGVPSEFVRYETLVADPRREVRRVLALAGHSDAPLDFLGERSVELGPAHTVAGNPMRFRTGSLEIDRDEEWRREMGPADRRVVSAIAFPMLVRYGYAGRSRSDAGEAGGAP